MLHGRHDCMIHPSTMLWYHEVKSMIVYQKLQKIQHQTQTVYPIALLDYPWFVKLIFSFFGSFPFPNSFSCFALSWTQRCLTFPSSLPPPPSDSPIFGSVMRQKKKGGGDRCDKCNDMTHLQNWVGRTSTQKNSPIHLKKKRVETEWIPPFFQKNFALVWYQKIPPCA